MPGRNAPDIKDNSNDYKTQFFFCFRLFKDENCSKGGKNDPACERLKLIASPILEIKIRRERFPAENSTPVIKKVEKNKSWS